MSLRLWLGGTTTTATATTANNLLTKWVLQSPLVNAISNYSHDMSSESFASSSSFSNNTTTTTNNNNTREMSRVMGSTTTHSSYSKLTNEFTNHFLTSLVPSRVASHLYLLQSSASSSGVNGVTGGGAGGVSVMIPPSIFMSHVATASMYPSSLMEYLMSTMVVVEEKAEEQQQQEEEDQFHLGVWLISTLKRRKKKMNKHKLRKRMKKLRLKNKK